MDDVPVPARRARRYRPVHPKGALAVLAVVASASAVAALVAFPTSMELDTACAVADHGAAHDTVSLRRDSLLAAACWPYLCVRNDQLHAN
jgi:hypothetical protein